MRSANPPLSPLTRASVLTMPLLAISLAILLLAPVAHAADAKTPWWNTDWRYRMRLRIDSGKLRAPTQVAWAKFPIPEGSHAKGADVRVIDDAGKPVRVHLSFFDPAVYGIVAFETEALDRPYWVYLGNPKPGLPPEAWEPKAGVFLETRRLEGGKGGNWKQMEEAVSRGTQPFGAGYRSRIYDGFNPFGEPDRYLSIYTAYLKLDQTRDHTFCTVSDDASALKIDGQRVCAWPGAHGPGNRILPHQIGKIRLKRGVRRLDYIHIDFVNPQTAVVGWHPPGKREFAVISPVHFVPIRRTSTGPLEEQGATITPNFQAAQTEWLRSGGNFFALYTFTDTTNGRVAKQTWRFSDGTAASGREIEKMFFYAADYDVTLEVEDSQGKIIGSTTRPFRVHAIDKKERVSETKLARQFVRQILDNLPEGLDRKGLVSAADLTMARQYLEETAQIYMRIVDQEWKASQRLDFGVLSRLLDLASRETFNEIDKVERFARNQIARLPESSGTDETKAIVYMGLGRIQMQHPDNLDAALASMRSAQLHLPEGKGQATEREVLLALGDVYRLMGEAELARKTYLKAQALPSPGHLRDFDISSFALTAEAYIRNEEYGDAQTVVDRWRNLYPIERMTGYASLLQARILAGRGKETEAIAELETFLACETQGVFAQQALEELGDLYAKERDAPQARATYQRLLDAFQDKEMRERVQGKLNDLGSK